MPDRAVITKILERIPYGLYVIGSLRGSTPVTMIANWLTQVSFHPPLIILAVEADSKMRGYIETTGYFSVNILPAGASSMARLFLKSPEAFNGTIAGRTFAPGGHGTPVLADATGAVECRVHGVTPAGDHVVIIGEIVDAVLHQEASAALTLRETGLRYSK
jgi:flavin reductase (DIM6/NTAB) family NADH-FMN oxidoreductase RutF